MFGSVVLISLVATVVNGAPLSALHKAKPHAIDAIALSQEGYQRVAGMKDNEQMKSFIRRTLVTLQLEVADEGELSGFVPHYSGELAVQDFERLKTELRAAKWVRPKAAVSAQPQQVHKRVARMSTVAAAGQSEKAATSRTSLRATTKAADAAPPVVTLAEAVQRQARVKANAADAALQPTSAVKEEDKAVAHVEPAKEKEQNKPTEADDLKAKVSELTKTLPVPVPQSESVQLPAVSTVLTKASDTLSNFTAQAALMQERLANKQKTSRTELAADKAKFEKELESLKAQSEAAKADNDRVRVNIGKMRLDNEALENDATNIRAGIDIMRAAGRNLFAKTEVAMEFLKDSLNATDDDRSDELKVLSPTTPKPDLDYYLNKARDELGLPGDLAASDADDSDGASSLLQLGNGDVPQSAESNEKLVSLLAQSLEKLDKVDHQARDTLRKRFEKLAEARQKDFEALTNDRAALDASLASLTDRNTGLQKAKEVLAKTFEQMSVRLNGFGVFARKVDAAMVDTVAAADLESKAP